MGSLTEEYVNSNSETKWYMKSHSDTKGTSSFTLRQKGLTEKVKKH